MREYRVINLTQVTDKVWKWQYEGIEAWYSTARNGCGIWCSARGVGVFQVVGMADFQACITPSGMRRKVQRLIDSEVSGGERIGWGLTHYVNMQ